MLERQQDRAWSCRPVSAFARQMVERGPRLLQSRDLHIQRRDPFLRQIAHPRPVVGSIQRQQRADLR